MAVCVSRYCESNALICDVGRPETKKGLKNDYKPSLSEFERSSPHPQLEFFKETQAENWNMIQNRIIKICAIVHLLLLNKEQNEVK